MYVYKMTNTANGISYVGATIRPLARRMSDHAKAARQGRTTLICAAIREFGMDSFKTEILYTASNFDELMALEIKAIKQEGTLEPNGYNRSSGGIGTPDCRALESTRLKIGLKSKGRIPSDATRRKMSLAKIGKSCPWNQRPTGRPAWNRGIPATDEVRKRLSELRTGGNNWKARRIEFQGVEYPSISDAVRATGLSQMQIHYRLKKGDSARYLDKEKN